MAAPPAFWEHVYEACPDDDSDKMVYVQASGSSYNGSNRHVLLWWSNGIHPRTKVPVDQIIQLTGEPNDCAYYDPFAQQRPPGANRANLQIKLGEFSREERDQIRRFAKDRLHHSCLWTSTADPSLVWFEGLLWAMVGAALITRPQFEDVARRVPLLTPMSRFRRDTLPNSHILPVERHVGKNAERREREWRGSDSE
jgi:hypothetical protein